MYIFTFTEYSLQTVCCLFRILAGIVRRLLHRTSSVVEALLQIVAPICCCILRFLLLNGTEKILVYNGLHIREDVTEHVERGQDTSF